MRGYIRHCREDWKSGTQTLKTHTTECELHLNSASSNE